MGKGQVREGQDRFGDGLGTGSLTISSYQANFLSILATKVALYIKRLNTNMNTLNQICQKSASSPSSSSIYWPAGIYWYGYPALLGHYTPWSQQRSDSIRVNITPTAHSVSHILHWPMAGLLHNPPLQPPVILLRSINVSLKTQFLDQQTIDWNS